MIKLLIGNVNTNLVQFQEDAGVLVLVVVEVFRRARMPVLDEDVADLTWCRWLAVVAVDTVVLVDCAFARLIVSCSMENDKN